MSIEEKIEMTLAELRAVVVRCTDCDNLATHDCHVEYGDRYCDSCASEDDGERDDIATIRAVQARIDGLSAQPAGERWVIRFQMPVSGTAYVKGSGVFTYNEADANAWPNEAEALAWARLALPVGSYKVVRL